MERSEFLDRLTKLISLLTDLWFRIEEMNEACSLKAEESKLRYSIMLLHSMLALVQSRQSDVCVHELLQNTRVGSLPGLPLNRPRTSPSLNYSWFTGKKNQAAFSALRGTAAWARFAINTIRHYKLPSPVAEIKQQQRWDQWIDFVASFEAELRKLGKQK